MKILILEDEREIAEAIAHYMEHEKYIVEIVETYREAYDKIAVYEYDCLIVDITLPDGNGLDLVKELRQRGSEVGILILSALDSLDSRVQGLNSGADDYLIKPFHLTELKARIRSILRRRCFNGQSDFVFNELTVCIDSRKIFVRNQPVPLTRKEFDLLHYLLVNRERVLSKESIVEHLWGDMMGVDADSFDFLYPHVRNLRKKMQEAGCSDYIRNVYGIGYKFSEE